MEWDSRSAILAFAPAVRGVFTLADLRAACGIRHERTFYLRLRELETTGDLSRFSRGIYVGSGFDPAVLSQVLCPESYISFEYVLARRLVIGAGPGNRIRAVKIGKRRLYTAPGNPVSVEQLGITASLFHGFETVAGVRYALPEKALLDTLYFHLRGYRFNFDIYSDLTLDRLDRGKADALLAAYANPRFVAFAKGILDG